MPSSDRRRDYGTVDRWLNAIIYYGLGQQLLLAFPFMWLIFQRPTDLDFASATIVAMSTGAVTVGVFRLGAIPDSRSWPTLSAAKLGTGTSGGYRAFVRRLASLSATLSLAVAAAVLVWLATGSVVLKLLTAALFAVVGVALVPSLDGDSTRAGLARIGHHAGGLLALAWLARPFDPSVGVPSAPLAFGVVVACVVVDAWPVGQQVRERVRRPDAVRIR